MKIINTSRSRKKQRKLIRSLKKMKLVELTKMEDNMKLAKQKLTFEYPYIDW
jgi:hypothetical protein